MSSLLLIKALLPYAACGVPPKWALLVPASANRKTYAAQVFRPVQPNDYPHVPFPRKPLGWDRKGWSSNHFEAVDDDRYVGFK